MFKSPQKNLLHPDWHNCSVCVSCELDNGWLEIATVISNLNFTLFSAGSPLQRIRFSGNAAGAWEYFTARNFNVTLILLPEQMVKATNVKKNVFSKMVKSKNC